MKFPGSSTDVTPNFASIELPVSDVDSRVLAISPPTDPPTRKKKNVSYLDLCISVIDSKTEWGYSVTRLSEPPSS